MGAFNNLVNNTSGGSGSIGYAPGNVYLGSENVPAGTAQSPTGGTYKVPAGKRDITKSVTDAKKLYITDPVFKAKWDKQVASAGFGSDDPIKSRMLWEMAVDGAADWYATSGGEQKVTPGQYLQWYAKTKNVGTKAENLPNRQVYMYDPATINNLIDKTLSDTLGRKPTASEQKDFYTAIQKMINEGTVTTSKERINPKTGKKESYTVTTPGFSTEKATSYIEQQIKTQSPQDYQEKKSLDFIDFLLGMKG